MNDIPVAWTVQARNLPDHATNKIHTDEGANAAGFESALIAGVTTYAYLTHPLVAAWGVDWLTRGGGEVRFKAPVFADARVDCVPTVDDDGGGDVTVEAVCPAQTRNPRATLRAVRDSGPPPMMRSGDPLPSRRIKLGSTMTADYGVRAGDDLELYADLGLMHPVIWPSIANDVFSAELVRGPWIHTRSIIRHHAPGPVGAVVTVHATVVERYERGGQRAIVDILVEHDGRPLATLEHEAIVDLG